MRKKGIKSIRSKSESS